MALSRRALIAAVAPAALSLAAVAQAQPSAPADPSKVVGARATVLGARSPFEQPQRTATGQQNSTARTPLDGQNGIITPSDLHYIVDHDTTPTIDPKKYTLTLHGLVDRPHAFAFTHS